MKYRKIDLEKDKQLILEFRKDVYGNSSKRRVELDEQAYLNRMQKRIQAHPNGQLIVENETSTIGQLGFYIEENTYLGYVNLIYLTKEQRGKGLGKKLLEHAEEYFKANDVLEYQLRVSKENDQAHEFYESMGFEIIEDDDENQKYLLSKLV